MKNVKKLFTPRLVSAVMALLLIFTAFASFDAVRAQATTDTPTTYSTNTYPDVYYFFDLYPTLNPADVNAIFPSSSVYYERNHVNEQEFAQMVHDEYFSDLSAGLFVIIDIKTFKPSTNVLELLFEPLKEAGCITGFISTYPESMFVTGSYPYVDFYFETDLGDLKNFVRNSFLDASYKQIVPTSNASILLDNNLIDVNEYENASIDELCAVSPYLRFIMKAFTDSIFDSDPTSYNDIANNLKNNNVQLLVYTGEAFVDILKWETVASPAYLNNGFAIGFWEFEESFYSYLYVLKQQYPNFPIYVFEAEPIEYSENGLPISSDTDLEEDYSRAVTNEYYFLDDLIGFLNSLS